VLQLRNNAISDTTQAPGLFVGRVCCESGEGRLNEASVQLEGGLSSSNGARVKLDLSKAPGLRIFTGQVGELSIQRRPSTDLIDNCLLSHTFEVLQFRRHSKAAGLPAGPFLPASLMQLPYATIYRCAAPKSLLPSYSPWAKLNSYNVVLQVIGVTGVNPTGSCLLASQLHTGAAPPLHATRPDELADKARQTGEVSSSLGFLQSNE